MVLGCPRTGWDAIIKRSDVITYLFRAAPRRDLSTVRPDIWQYESNA